MRFLGCFIPIGGLRSFNDIPSRLFLLSRGAPPPLADASRARRASRLRPLAWPQALFRYLDQVPHLMDHAARVGCVLELHRVANPPQPHAPHDRRLVVLEADRALDQGHLDRARAFGIRALIGHFLLCAGAPPPAPVPSPLTRLGLASSGCPLSERYPLKLVRSPSSL